MATRTNKKDKIFSIELVYKACRLKTNVDDLDADNGSSNISLTKPKITFKESLRGLAKHCTGARNGTFREHQQVL